MNHELYYIHTCKKVPMPSVAKTFHLAFRRKFPLIFGCFWAFLRRLRPPTASNQLPGSQIFSMHYSKLWLCLQETLLKPCICMNTVLTHSFSAVAAATTRRIWRKKVEAGWRRLNGDDVWADQSLID